MFFDTFGDSNLFVSSSGIYFYINYIYGENYGSVFVPGRSRVVQTLKKWVCTTRHRPVKWGCTSHHRRLCARSWLSGN
jgi:hypothetical protein